MSWLDRWRSRGAGPEHEDESSDPQLAALLSRARSLPREVEPGRDLWSGIENRIAQQSEPVPGRPEGWTARCGFASLFPRPVAALALAAVLVTTTALVSTWLAQQPAAPPSDAEVALIAAELRQRDGVADVHESLVAILDARRGDLPAETMAALEDNLRSIDRAIAEIHLALESNPDHPSLSFLLAEAYRREADLLERLEWWMRSPSEVRS